MKKLIVLFLPLVVLSGCIKVEEFDPCKGTLDKPVLASTVYAKNLGDTLKVSVVNSVPGASYQWTNPNGTKTTSTTGIYEAFLGTTELDGSWQVKATSNDGLCVSETKTFSVDVNGYFPTCSMNNNYLKIGSSSTFSLPNGTSSSSAGYYTYRRYNTAGNIELQIGKKGQAFIYSNEALIITDKATQSLTANECNMTLTYGGVTYKAVSGRFYTQSDSWDDYMKFCNIAFESSSGATLSVSGYFYW